MSILCDCCRLSILEVCYFVFLTFFLTLFSSLYISFDMCYHLIQRRCKLLSEELITLSLHEVVLKFFTNISWFGWTTLMVTILNWARYSLRIWDEPWRILKRQVAVIFMCLVATTWWTSFFTMFWSLVMQSRGRTIYHPRVMSQKVLERSMQFK